MEDFISPVNPHFQPIGCTPVSSLPVAPCLSVLEPSSGPAFVKIFNVYR